MTTVDELISEVQRHVRPSGFETINALAAAVTAGATTLSFSSGTNGIGTGSLLSVGLEDTRVLSVNQSASSAVVARGQSGSTAAAHSAGDVIQVDSRTSKWVVFRAIRDELRSLSSPRKGLFRVATVDLTYNPSYRGYDLTGVTSIIGEPIAVLREPDNGDRNWIPIRRWRFEADLATADFASGMAIFLDEGAHAGRRFRLKYRTDFSTLTADLTADVETVTGFPAYAINVLHYGAAIRLLEQRPSERADTRAQGDSRRAEEVTVSDTLRAPAALRERYDDELASAVARLASQNRVRLR